MNFFEQEMRQMFDAASEISDKKFIGKTMIGKLDDELRVKLQLVAPEIAKHYSAIQVSIINRTDGVIDKQSIAFGDVIGLKATRSGEKVNPYMWENNNSGVWYIPVTLSEKAEIGDAVLDYVGMYQEDGLAMQFK